jgi:hypothetical protein
VFAQCLFAFIAIELVALFSLRGSAGRESPGGDSLFFASPKKPKEKKGDPTVWVPSLRYGQPVLPKKSGGRARTRFAQTIARPDPAFLGQHRPSQDGVGAEAGSDLDVFAQIVPLAQCWYVHAAIELIARSACRLALSVAIYGCSVLGFGFGFGFFLIPRSHPFCLR